MAKYQAANASPGVSDVVFGFVNLDRDDVQTGNFNVNITQNGSNLFGIQRGRVYNVRNIAAFTGVDSTRRNTFLIPNNATGDSLLDNGLYASLNKVPTADADWSTAPFEAQYLKLYDVTPPPSDSAPTSAKGYGLGNTVTFNWSAVTDTLGGISGYRLVVSANPDGSNPIFNGLVGNVTAYTLNNVTPGQTLYARVDAVNNAGVEGTLSAASAATPVLDPNGDADGDGTTNAAEDAAGTNPLDATSVFRVVSVTANSATNMRQITWNSVPGKRYQVQYSPDLITGSFTTISAVLSATSATTTYTDQPTNVTKGFYRVQVVP